MIACCFTHPLDLLKVRLQADQSRKGTRVTTAAITIVRNEVLSCKTATESQSALHNFMLVQGFLALYNGLSAALLRQG